MIRVVVFSVLLLAACAPTQQRTYRDLDQISRDFSDSAARQPQNADEATRADACGAARFQHLIGTHMDAIDRATLPPRARIITPDAMVTQDFVPARLNIFTGVDGTVGSLRCF